MFPGCRSGGRIRPFHVGQLLAELGPVGVFGDKSLEDPQCLGARRPERADASFRAAMKLGIGVASLLALLYAVAPGLLVRFFVPGVPEVERLGSLCLRISAIELPLMVLALVLAGGLRGAGDTRSPVLVAVVGVWLVRIPLFWLFTGPLGWGLAGAWTTMIFDWGTRAAILWLLWKRGRWKAIKV